jgi:hypothetical protein
MAKGLDRLATILNHRAARKCCTAMALHALFWCNRGLVYFDEYQ